MAGILCEKFIQTHTQKKISESVFSTFFSPSQNTFTKIECLNVKHKTSLVKIKQHNTTSTTTCDRDTISSFKRNCLRLLNHFFPQHPLILKRIGFPAPLLPQVFHNSPQPDKDFSIFSSRSIRYSLADNQKK